MSFELQALYASLSQEYAELINTFVHPGWQVAGNKRGDHNKTSRQINDLGYD